ncbi:MAG: pyridoxal phosphate-dependent aminotransferase [Asgard group archaeon]|nr:pyridoxal phosphate-dependent aminotransferase [Asgard group archaeon]
MNAKKEWNFDEVIDRSETHAVKWNAEFMKEYFGAGDLLPLWVADMDFKSPEILIDTLKERIDHGIFGYTITPESYFQAIINWFKEKHNWEIEKDWIRFSPGVVSGIGFIIQGFSKPGDSIIIQEPVYYPFASIIKSNGRIVSNNELKIGDKHYEMDFADLEKKCKEPRVKLMILCSPHNPVGRVWTKEELTQLGEICIDNNVTVISDEIHCDLIKQGFKHTPFASLSDKFAKNSFTNIAPSKTFNIAGLKTSSVIIPNTELCKEYTQTTGNVSVGNTSIIGALAAETAYNKCGDWLEAALEYIYNNFLFTKEFLAKEMPEVKVFDLEGTYLVWADFRKLGINPKTLDEIIKKDAKVAYDDGAMFGESGAGFQRINVACPRSILQEALEKTVEAVKNHINKK